MKKWGMTITRLNILYFTAFSTVLFLYQVKDRENDDEDEKFLRHA